MVLDEVWRLAMCDLPDDFSLRQVDGADRSVRRFHQGKPADRHATAWATNGSCQWIRFGAVAGSGTSRSRSGRSIALDVGEIVLWIGLSNQTKHTRKPLGIDVENVRLRIVRPAGPDRSAGCRSHAQRSEGSFDLADDRRRENRTELVARRDLESFCAELRGEVDQVIDGEALRVVAERTAARVERERLSRRVPFAG